MKIESTHEKKVERIAKQLKERKSTTPISLKKNVVSHQVPKPKERKYYDDKIDISELNKIINIDPKERTCVAEPVVIYSDLVDATMRYGLVPIIVPEFKTITIGGAVAGCSIESMSYKYGGFHDTCDEYEVITANGEALNCTPDNENSLLFQMMHGTFGTLGIISKIKFKLIPSKPFVKIRFENSKRVVRQIPKPSTRIGRLQLQITPCISEYCSFSRQLYGPKATNGAHGT
jgi:FAD/FMN-containing dehydrogenase